MPTAPPGINPYPMISQIIEEGIPVVHFGLMALIPRVPALISVFVAL